MKKIIFWMMAAVSLSLLIWSSLHKNNSFETADDKIVVVGSKNFSESILLAHMFADLIEAYTDLKVIRKVNLGGSNLAWTAIKNNDIQLYPEYSGTIIMNYYQQEIGPADKSFEKADQLLQADNLSFITNLGFDNRYVVAISPKLAAKKRITSLTDLSSRSQGLKFACDFEFIDRPDGYSSLSQFYPMHFSTINCMDHGFLYRALQNNFIDAIATFSTDAQLDIYNFTLLEDHKGFSSSYITGILIRNDLVARHPEVAKVLSRLQGQITGNEMRGLNKKLEYEGLKAQDVAHKFLKNKGLL